ncbi:amidohydrolase family protein [Bacteroidota bacterium]
MKNIQTPLFIITAALSIMLLFSGCRQKPDPEKEQSVAETLLLKNYKPKSIYNLPETKVEQAMYPVIDMHAHVYAETKEEVAKWVKTMDDKGIQKVIVLSQAYGSRFDSIVDLYSEYPERFSLWCGFDYSGYNDPGFPEDAIRELKRCAENGAKGVGELGDKGKGLFYCKPEAYGMHPDDPRMDKLWAACAELNLPVSLHVADPKWMYETMDSTNDGMMNALKWRLDNQEGIKSLEEMVEILGNTLKRNPGTTFIACHFANCSFDFSLVEELLDSYPNLYLDISARFAETCAIPRRSKSFYTSYQDRIVYGTDMGRDVNMYEMTFRLLETNDEHIYLPYNTYHWPLHALNLEDNILKKIYRENALKLVL